MRETNAKQNAILKLLAYHGFYAWRQNSGKINIGKRWINLGNEGLSDIIGFHRLTGRFVAIECKQEKEKVRPKQTAFLDTVERAGGISLIAYTVDDVARRLRELCAK